MALDTKYVKQALTVADSATVSQPQVVGLPSSLAMRSRAPFVVGLGDSITAGATTEDGTVVFLGTSTFNLLCALMGDRWRYLRNSGIGGETSTQILARLQADVIARGADVCVYAAGTNDVGGAVTEQQTKDNFAAAKSGCLAAGILFIGCTIPPKGDTDATPTVRARLLRYNAWVRAYCAANDIVCLDRYAAVVDPATGDYRAGLAVGDKVHPSAPGVRAIAEADAAVLRPLFPVRLPPLAVLSKNTVSAVDYPDLTNLVANGTFATDSGKFDGTGKTFSLVADANVVGNWLQCVRDGTATSGYVLYLELRGGSYAPGDRISLACRLQVEGAEASGLTYSVSVGFNVQGQLAPAGSWNHDITQPGGAVLYAEKLVPAGATAAVLSVYCDNAGAGTIRVAQPQVTNLTALGLVGL